MGTWEVTADEDKNRLYMRLEGHFEEEEAGEATDETIAAAERLEEGFDIVNDLGNFQPGDAEAMKHVERGKSTVAEMGASAAVRVMPDSTTGELQWNRAGEDAESYPVAMAETREQAEKLLDDRRKQQE